MSTATDHIEYDGPRFAMIPEWLLFDPTISMSAKAVYGVLVRHGSNPSNCFPSTARIAALLGTTNKTVRKLIDELVEHGVVERHARYNENGGFTSNGYVVRGRETPPHRPISDTDGDDPWPQRNQPPLGRTEPTPWVERNQPLVPTEPLKENQLTRAKTTRKRTRVDSLENAQQPLIEVDGLAPAASVPDRFQEFWSSYPRKIGKPKAQAAWKRLVKAKVDPQTIIDGCTRWATYYAQARTEERFIPHPTTWLNDARYDDTPEPVNNSRASHPTRAPIVERTDQTMNMRFVDGKLVPA